MQCLRGIFASLCLAGWLAAHADEPPGYYNVAEGKAGVSLRHALHGLIKGHHVVSYSTTTPGTTNTADALKVLDEDPANANNVILIYSRRSEAKTNFGTTAGWNREHLWPNSYGLDSRQPAYSDLHNLRPEDATVNSARGNKFDDYSATNSSGYRKPATAEAPLTSTDSDSWEPPDVVKGDIARALFYMAVRYTGDPTNEPALYLTDNLPQITSTTNLMGRLTTLLLWNRLDPADAAERHRNDMVYERYQHNRNPFVDHPEFLEAAFLPSLAIRADGPNVFLDWAAEYTSAIVETTSDFRLPWIVPPQSPALVNGQWQVILPAGNSAGFHRLRLR